MSSVEQKAPVDYRAMVEHILTNGGKVFLFASPSVASMPVTIPANVAMLLAWERGRCMLIDLDMQRDAVGRAFEVVQRAGEKPKAYQTSIENLHVWPARNFVGMGPDGPVKIIGRARENAEYVVVNAPGLMKFEERGRIVMFCDGAFVFGEETEGEITRLAKAFRCEVMKK
jgi:hypothetical protein